MILGVNSLLVGAPIGFIKNFCFGNQFFNFIVKCLALNRIGAVQMVILLYYYKMFENFHLNFLKCIFISTCFIQMLILSILDTISMLLINF